MLTLVVPCVPVPWKAHAGYGNRSFNPRYLEREYYQYEFKKQYTRNFPLEGPLKISYEFALPIPTSASKKFLRLVEENKVHHVKRPDQTNLLKFAEDALKGIVIKDDSQVVEGHQLKFYSKNPHTKIEITELD